MNMLCCKANAGAVAAVRSNVQWQPPSHPSRQSISIHIWLIQQHHSAIITVHETADDWAVAYGQGMDLAARVLKAAGARAMYLWQETKACTWTADAAALPGETDFAKFLEAMHRTGMCRQSNGVESVSLCLHAYTLMKIAV